MNGMGCGSDHNGSIIYDKGQKVLQTISFALNPSVTTAKAVGETQKILSKGCHKKYFKVHFEGQHG